MLNLPAGRFAAVALLGLFWGLNWPAVKIALAEVPPVPLRAIGFSAGALILFALAVLRRRGLLPRRGEILPILMAGMLNILAFNLFTAFGQLNMATSRAAIIAFTMPAWAALLAWPLLGERPGLRQAVGLACGMAGLAVLLGVDALRGAALSPLGVGFMLGAAVSWALGTVVMKRTTWTSSMIVVTGWQYAVAALPMIVAAALIGGLPSPAGLSAPVLGALAYHIVFSIGLAQTMWFLIVRRLSVGQATLGTLLTPIVGVSGSVLLLGDALTWNMLAALALVLAAVACVMGPVPKRAKKPAVA
ncbi:DMT family transporter [Stappia sp.]|uniref:DMT family transporter n=1 Tax=Stappia sp. TaxID=1870903 RepID=UPI0032D8C789